MAICCIDNDNGGRKSSHNTNLMSSWKLKRLLECRGSSLEPLEHFERLNGHALQFLSNILLWFYSSQQISPVLYGSIDDIAVPTSPPSFIIAYHRYNIDQVYQFNQFFVVCYTLFFFIVMRSIPELERYTEQSTIWIGPRQRVVVSRLHRRATHIRCSPCILVLLLCVHCTYMKFSINENGQRRKQRRIMFRKNKFIVSLKVYFRNSIRNKSFRQL